MNFSYTTQRVFYGILGILNRVNVLNHASNLIFFAWAGWKTNDGRPKQPNC
jgi:hypothetical protein